MVFISQRAPRDFIAIHRQSVRFLLRVAAQEDMVSGKRPPNMQHDARRIGESRRTKRGLRGENPRGRDGGLELALETRVNISSPHALLIFTARNVRVQFVKAMAIITVFFTPLLSFSEVAGTEGSCVGPSVSGGVSTGANGLAAGMMHWRYVREIGAEVTHSWLGRKGINSSQKSRRGYKRRLCGSL